MRGRREFWKAGGLFRLTKFNVLLSPVAGKFLSGMDEKTRERIKAGLRNLGEDPFRRRPKADIKKLEGSRNPELYRMRIGDFRALYAVIGKDVRITEIIKRGKGYEWLD